MDVTLKNMRNTMQVLTWINREDVNILPEQKSALNRMFDDLHKMRHQRTESVVIDGENIVRVHSGLQPITLEELVITGSSLFTKTSLDVNSIPKISVYTKWNQSRSRNYINAEGVIKIAFRKLFTLWTPRAKTLFGSNPPERYCIKIWSFELCIGDSEILNYSFCQLGFANISEHSEWLSYIKERFDSVNSRSSLRNVSDNYPQQREKPHTRSQSVYSSESGNIKYSQAPAFGKSIPETTPIPVKNVTVRKNTPGRPSKSNRDEYRKDGFVTDDNDPILYEDEDSPVIEPSFYHKPVPGFSGITRQQTEYRNTPYPLAETPIKNRGSSCRTFSPSVTPENIPTGSHMCPSTINMNDMSKAITPAQNSFTQIPPITTPKSFTVIPPPIPVPISIASSDQSVITGQYSISGVTDIFERILNAVSDDTDRSSDSTTSFILNESSKLQGDVEMRDIIDKSPLTEDEIAFARYIVDHVTDIGDLSFLSPDVPSSLSVSLGWTNVVE